MITPGERLAAADLIALVLDRGSVERWDEPPVRPTPSSDYQADLTQAAERSGVDEAVVTGRGTVDGEPLAFVVGEFRFLAGSIGVATADRIVAAVDRATSMRLPLVAATASGGTRMQEGTVAFVQMLRIAGAIAAHKASGLPYLVYLRHPTTGGVTATWGSLGHVTAAEPGALVGFLGPRVYEAMTGTAFPAGVQTAENLCEKGVIDAVLPPERIRDVLPRALRLMRRPEVEVTSRPSVSPSRPTSPVHPVQPRDPGHVTLPPPPRTLTPERDGRGTLPSGATGDGSLPAWRSVQRSRDPGRCGVFDMIDSGAEDFVRLSGTGEGERHPSLVLALAKFAGVPCVMVGQDRHGQHAGRLLGPGALREARRGFRLAVELGLPLLTVIDTPGAELSVDAEEGALAGEIARCIADLMTMPTGVVSVLLGEGGGGGALALLPADVTVATSSSWLAPLPPEGASAIVHRTADRAPEMAQAQQIDAPSMVRDGIVDVLIDDPAGARPAEVIARVVAAVGTALQEVVSRGSPDDGWAAARARRYGQVGHRGAESLR